MHCSWLTFASLNLKRKFTAEHINSFKVANSTHQFYNLRKILQVLIFTIFYYQHCAAYVAFFLLCFRLVDGESLGLDDTCIFSILAGDSFYLKMYIYKPGTGSHMLLIGSAAFLFSVPLICICVCIIFWIKLFSLFLTFFNPPTCPTPNKRWTKTPGIQEVPRTHASPAMLSLTSHFVHQVAVAP